MGSIWLGRWEHVEKRLKHGAKGWDMFASIFLFPYAVDVRVFAMVRCTVNIVLVTYSMDIDEASFDAGFGF